MLQFFWVVTYFEIDGLDYKDSTISQWQIIFWVTPVYTKQIILYGNVIYI